MDGNDEHDGGLTAREDAEDPSRLARLLYAALKAHMGLLVMFRATLDVTDRTDEEEREQYVRHVVGVQIRMGAVSNALAALDVFLRFPAGNEEPVANSPPEDVSLDEKRARIAAGFHRPVNMSPAGTPWAGSPRRSHV